MKEKVLRTIEERKLIDAGDRVLVGCSGGADSMCLLHLLALLQEPLDFSLYAVHVHHHLRADSADMDAALVEETCRKLNVPCTVLHRDVPAVQTAQKISAEEAARDARYDAFREEAVRIGANKLAVAHHSEDRAETMLFQMIRGSGLRGSAGMQPKRAFGELTVIRPLLEVSKEEILAYDRGNGIPWREDETNREDSADRNRLRHYVLPELEKIRPDAVGKLNALGAYFTEVDDYLRAEARAWTAVYMRNTQGVIPEDPFRDTPKILKEYIVAEVLRKLQMPMKDKGRVHLDSVAALADVSVGKRVRVSNEWEAVRTYQGIAFGKTAGDEEPGDPAAGHGRNAGDPETAGGDPSALRTLPVSALTLETRVFPYEKGMEIPRKEYTKWFDYDKMEGPPKLRTRRPHDVFSQAAGAHKKLKDFFIDEKIPQQERGDIPLVADGSTVLWIVGVRMSEEYKVTEDTKNVLEITVRRKEK